MGPAHSLTRTALFIHVSCPLFKHRSFVAPQKGTWRMLPGLFFVPLLNVFIFSNSHLSAFLHFLSLISLPRAGGQAWLILLMLCGMTCMSLSFDPSSEDNIIGLCVLNGGLLGSSHTCKIDKQQSSA